MFPAGAAGAALFALRVAVMATLLFDGAIHAIQPTSLWALSGLAIVALFLCLGLFTPYCSVFCILAQSYLLLRYGDSDEFHLALNIVISLVLALLGPGAYSLDARIFGRRRLVLPPHR
jgi:uncharacterized membrane protein YphA (DoxX/SURF4 family)